MIYSYQLIKFYVNKRYPCFHLLPRRTVAAKNSCNTYFEICFELIYNVALVSKVWHISKLHFVPNRVSYHTSDYTYSGCSDYCPWSHSCRSNYRQCCNCSTYLQHWKSSVPRLSCTVARGCRTRPCGSGPGGGGRGLLELFTPVWGYGAGLHARNSD